MKQSEGVEYRPLTASNRSLYSLTSDEDDHERHYGHVSPDLYEFTLLYCRLGKTVTNVPTGTP